MFELIGCVYHMAWAPDGTKLVLVGTSSSSCKLGVIDLTQHCLPAIGKVLRKRQKSFKTIPQVTQARQNFLSELLYIAFPVIYCILIAVTSAVLAFSWRTSGNAS